MAKTEPQILDIRLLSAEDMKQRVVKLICEASQKNDVTIESRLIEDLHFDSLDFVDLMLRLEQSCKVKISDDEAERFRTVGDLVLFLEAKLADVSGGII
jgi:acyl carrier protein